MRKNSRKRPYRAVHLSRFEWDGICERVESRRVVVGVDVAKEAMVAAVVMEDEEVLKTVRWSHPLETDEFLQFVERLKGRAIDVAVAMEPSGVYGDALRWRLLGAGFGVFRVSPKKSHDMSEIYDGVPSSHGRKSAAIIAVLHGHGASERWPRESERKPELTAALRLVEVFGKQFRQNRNRLEGLTARHWPELTLTLDLGMATTLELLTALGGPERVAQKMGESRALMKRVGGTMLASEKIEGVLAGAACS